MNTIFKKHKIAAIFFSSIILMGLALYFGAAFMVKDIKDKSDEIQRSLIDIQIQDKRIDKIPEMENINAEIQENKKALDVIYSSDEEVSLINKLESLGEETGNKVNLSVNEQAIMNEKNVKKTTTKKNNEEKSITDSLAYGNYLSMQISLEGDYAGLVNYMHRLENMNRYVNIISIESKKVNGEERKNMTTNIFDESRAETGNDQRDSEDDKETIVSTLNIIIYTQK
jgi:hypothetical protein